MLIIKRTKWLLLVGIMICQVLSGQTRFKLADPVSVAGSGGGWNVTHAAGALTQALPVATVQGELPISLDFRLNASHAVQVNHLWQSVPTWAYTDEGIKYRTYEVVDQGQSFYDRPMYGTIHFGYISAGATYGYVPESPSYVLEDGRIFRAGDFVAFSTLSSGSFDLAQKFGFSPKAASAVSVDPSGTLGLYSAVLSEFGTWQNTIQSHAPVNYGTASTQYMVLMDKNKARVFNFIAAFNAWVPILWVDRFGHYVTFQWTQTTSGLSSGILNTNTVEAVNQRGKGIKLNWANYQSTVTSAVDIVRADFVGITAPSIFIKGYPGLATARPNIMASLGPSSGIIKPDVPGPVFRPTQVQIGDSGTIALPNWGSGTPVVPLAPPQGGDAFATTITWTFTYDANHASLVSSTSPLGAVSSWSYATNMFITPGGIGSGYSTGYNSGLWRSNIDSTYLFGVTQMDITDSITSEVARQSWARTLPDGGSQTQWKVIYKSWFPGKGSWDRYTEFNYAPTTSEREYSNGSLMSTRLLTSSGAVLASSSATWVGSTLNPYSSSLQGRKITRSGEPDRTTSFEYIDTKNIQIKQINTYIGPQLNFPVASTIYTWGTNWNLLDIDKPTAITEKRFNQASGALISPSRTQMISYDLTTLFPAHAYLDAGAAGNHGQAFAYDNEGRLNFVQVSHDEPGFSGIIPYYSSIGFDSNTGLPNSKTTYYWDPDSSQRSQIVESQSNFDSAGRAQTFTSPNGLSTKVAYDIRGRVKSIATDGSASVSYTYDDERTIQTTQNGRTTIDKRDGFGRLIKRTNPDGSYIQYTYDLYGRLASQKDVTWNGISRNTMTIGYDGLDRTKSQSSPYSTGITFSYSVESGAYSGANDLAVVTKTAMGIAISSKTYTDVYGQIVKQISPTGEIISNTYDGSGQLAKISITPPAGSAIMTTQERIFRYDSLGRLISKQEPETGNITFSNFDGLNLPGKINEGVLNGVPTRSRNMIYDGLGRVRRVTNGSDSLSYVYQGTNLMTAISNHSGESVIQSYQYWPDVAKAKQLMAESLSTTGITPSFSTNIKYDYDSIGRLSSITYPDLRSIKYVYDQDSRIVEIKNNDQPLVTNITFDDWGNRSTLKFASGAYSEWKSKDFGMHLDSWSVKYSTGTTLSGPRSYGYDSGERLTQAGEWSITPDASGRMLAANAATFGINTSHQYDSYGNNTYHQATGVGVPLTMNNFSFGSMPTNGVPSGNTGWIINAMGEANRIGNLTGSSEGLALGWDGLGRLATATGVPNGVIQSYRYAASGLRINTIDTAQPGNNRRYAYSTGGLLLAEYTDSGWNRDVVYLGAEAIAEITNTGVFELHSDHLGTPRVITYGNGSTSPTVAGIQSFGPFGEYIPLQSTGYKPISGYTGHLQTDASGLIYMRGRYYSPSWHRFISSDHGVDPNSINQVAYAVGAPMSVVDPSGLTVTCSNGKILNMEQRAGETWDQFMGRVNEACGGGGATVEVSGSSGVEAGIPTTGFGAWGQQTLLPGPGYRPGGGPSNYGEPPQSPKPDPCTTVTKGDTTAWYGAKLRGNAGFERTTDWGTSPSLGGLINTQVYTFEERGTLQLGMVPGSIGVKATAITGGVGARSGLAVNGGTLFLGGYQVGVGIGVGLEVSANKNGFSVTLPFIQFGVTLPQYVPSSSPCGK